jgi:hypothetical protein
VQYSAVSQGMPVPAARHSVVGTAKPSGGQSRDVPVQISATSQGVPGACGRHVVVADA